MEIYRYWQSYKQSKTKRMLSRTTTQVLVNGEWIEYTELTSFPDGKCNWDDAILIVESKKRLPIKVNGVINKYD